MHKHYTKLMIKFQFSQQRLKRFFGSKIRKNEWKITQKHQVITYEHGKYNQYLTKNLSYSSKSTVLKS